MSAAERPRRPIVMAAPTFGLALSATAIGTYLPLIARHLGAPTSFAGTSFANFSAPASPRPQHTKLPFPNTNTSPSFPSASHFGTHHDSCSCTADGGSAERRRGRMKRSAVVRVYTGWIVLRVGVGFERMGSEAAAERRRGVVALGLGGRESFGSLANPRHGTVRRAGRARSRAGGGIRRLRNDDCALERGRFRVVLSRLNILDDTLRMWGVVGEGKVRTRRRSRTRTRGRDRRVSAPAINILSPGICASRSRPRSFQP